MTIKYEGCGTTFERKGDFAFHHCPNNSCQWVYWASQNALNSSHAHVPASQVQKAHTYICMEWMIQQGSSMLPGQLSKARRIISQSRDGEVRIVMSGKLFGFNNEF